MSIRDPAVELDQRFSSEGATPLPWGEVARQIDVAEIFWLSTVRRDGRPHVTPLPAIWHEGALHFCTGPEEQKAMNLENNPFCALTTGCNQFRSGLDLVVEGKATMVTDRGLLERLAALWLSKLDWRFEVTDEGFRDPEVDEPQAKRESARVYAVAPSKILAFGKGEPFSQTRYRF